MALIHSKLMLPKKTQDDMPHSSVYLPSIDNQSQKHDTALKRQLWRRNPSKGDLQIWARAAFEHMWLQARDLRHNSPSATGSLLAGQCEILSPARGCMDQSATFLSVLYPQKGLYSHGKICLRHAAGRQHCLHRLQCIY